MHYHYQFAVVPTVAGACLSIKSVYLYQSISLPLGELNDFRDKTAGALADGGWAQEEFGSWRLGDLLCTVRRHVNHPQDERAGRSLPSGYESLDVTVESVACVLPRARRYLPWEVLARGIRRRDTRGEPTVVPSLAGLARYLPFQVELGCGISTEAGIPALHHLHDLYSVTDRDTGAFVFGGDADALLSQVLSDPARHLHRRGQMMYACLKAEPTPAHRVLRDLRDRQALLMPIITNNFDGLHTRMGLDECYVRRYDEDVPDVPIHPDAKALLVIGSHADRRKVQARFRERGLPIFFLDPEGFSDGGKFVPYEIEGARDGDYIRRAGATAGLLQLAQELGLYAIR